MKTHNGNRPSAAHKSGMRGSEKFADPKGEDTSAPPKTGEPGNAAKEHNTQSAAHSSGMRGTSIERPKALEALTTDPVPGASTEAAANGENTAPSYQDAGEHVIVHVPQFGEVTVAKSQFKKKA